MPRPWKRSLYVFAHGPCLRVRTHGPASTYVVFRPRLLRRASDALGSRIVSVWSKVFQLSANGSNVVEGSFRSDSSLKELQFRFSLSVYWA